MLVAHWMACTWYAIAFTEHANELSWLSKLAMESNHPFNDSNPLQGPELKSRYLTSLYYVMTLCTTVGFGNVSANTDNEKIFTICGMVIGGNCTGMHSWWLANRGVCEKKMYKPLCISLFNFN